MDPTSRRSNPPPHPAGYPALDDAPVHLAPAIDVRESVRRAREELLGGAGTRSWPSLPAAGAAAGSAAPAVGTTSPMALRAETSADGEPPSSSGGELYTLAFPVEERQSRPPPPEDSWRVPARGEAEPSEASPRTIAFGAEPRWPARPASSEPEPGEPEPCEPSPQTVAFEPARARLASAPSASRAPGRDDEPIDSSPRTVAFEPPRAIVPRASVAIGQARSDPPPDAWPQPEAWSSAARAPALDAEPAPESALPPSVVLPLHSYAPEAAMPAALAHLLDTPDPTGERVAIARDLASIGALDERPDRESEREVGAKATLARARTLRFRLTLLDSFDDAPLLAGSIPPGVVPIDLAIDAALLVGFADGAPFVRHAAAGAELPFVRALASFMRTARPDVPRSVLRERGAASIARLTVAGYRAAIDALGRAALEITLDGRVLALDAAAFVSLAPSANGHRLGALADLERALSLRTGSVAQALELAHRRRR